MYVNEDKVCEWFSRYGKPVGSIDAQVYTLNDKDTENLKNFLFSVIPDCYITKDEIQNIITDKNLSTLEILEAVIPDPGRVMAGDFGEILTLFYISSGCDKKIKKIFKLRFKSDRNESLTKYDVILIFQENTNASENDFVIFAEAKVKSTKHQKKDLNPIENSIIDVTKNRTSRIAATLRWLKARSIRDQTGTIDLELIKRFTEEPLVKSFKKKFKAVSIIDSDFLDKELVKKISISIPTQNDNFEVIVLGIKELNPFYRKIYDSVLEENNDD